MTADGRIPPRAMYRKASSALLPESALTGAAVRSALPTRSVTVRKVFSIVSILAVLAVVLQFYFAGVGHFSIPEEGLFGIDVAGRGAVLLVDGFEAGDQGVRLSHPALRKGVEETT
jgi:hypothetical protein